MEGIHVNSKKVTKRNGRISLFLEEYAAVVMMQLSVEQLSVAILD